VGGGALEVREEGAVLPRPAAVVTVQAGTRYPDLYVDRLRSMVARHLPWPHRLVCYTDRAVPGRFHPEVEVRDLSGWGLAGWFNKLRLFDREVTGEAPFLFLDLTMVIRGSLAPLLEAAASPERAGASLVAVADWNYEIVNSSVMLVRPDARTQAVWDDWKAGVPHLENPAGDQNWIDAVFRARFPEALAFWPGGLVASYKGLRKRATRDPEGARRALEAAAILKFHGRPKAEEVLAPWRHLPSTVLRHPLRPRLWRYLAPEIEAHWR
jgi:hypothetical protein